MKGSVRTMEKCAVCKESYQRVKHPLTKDVIDLMCPEHLTRPSRVSQLREELERRVAEELRAALAHKSSVTTMVYYVRHKEEG